MSIQERTNGGGTKSYRAQIRVRGFPHLSKTFTRKTDAKKWLEETKTAIRGGNAASTEAQRTTLKEALERYAREIIPGKKGEKRDRARVKAWQQNPLALRFLSQLRGSDFANYRDERRAKGRAENTIAIELKMISKLYKVAARDWGMEGLRNPIQSVTMPGASRQRDRRLQPNEEKALLAELAHAGPYMVPLASLAIETAMRQGELLVLTWSDVDLQNRVAHLADTKNSEPRDVPLSSRAVEILRALPRPLDATARVFPLTQGAVVRTFIQSRKAAGIQDLRFHDLRREAASRLFERGLNVAEVAAITGHKTWSQLKRYTKLKAEDLARKLA